MNKEERIDYIEKRLRGIFNQDVIRVIDVMITKDLLSQWKKLNEHKDEEL